MQPENRNAMCLFKKYVLMHFFYLIGGNRRTCRPSTICILYYNILIEGYKSRKLSRCEQILFKLSVKSEALCTKIFYQLYFENTFNTGK